MARFLTALLAGLLLLAPAARAAENPAAGTWKFTFGIPSERGPLPLTLLVMLSESDKGWAGDILATSLQLRAEPKFDSVSVKNDAVSFVIKIGSSPISFDGRISSDGKKIRGLLDGLGKSSLIIVAPSKLKDFKDKMAMARETLDTTTEGNSEYFDVVFEMLSHASPKGKADKEKKDIDPKAKEEPGLKVEEVRAIVDKAIKLAEPFGERWQRTVSRRIASILVEQEQFASVAIELARQTERMLKPDDTALQQMQVLDGVAFVLRQAKKFDELKPIENRLVKLEARDFADYSKKHPPFKTEEFKGRKGKSNRAILVEVFTGAECMPCVAADLACDALETTYKSSDVVLLQYHLHMPSPDPLANKDTMERAELLQVRGPATFINGKRDGTGGGLAAQAKVKYSAFRELIDDLLEKEPGAKLRLSASRKGDEISIKANVVDLAKPSEKVTLRLALTEERVRYQGGNGLRYHHSVVRALPGGAKGFALTKKDTEQATTVSVEKVRGDLVKYLDSVTQSLREKEGDDEFPNDDRPLALKNLRVVAFVQDDETGEILQAAQVEVDEK